MLLSIAVAALAGCMTLQAPQPDLPATLLVGQLKLDVSGIGHAINGADGTINAYYPAGGIVTVQNEATGTQYMLKTVAPANLYAVPFVEPGRYRILSFWCQVETFNAWITLSTMFRTSPEFEVSEGGITNLGILLWKFRFDLWASTNTASFSQPEGGDAWVEKAFTRAHEGSPWLRYPIASAPVTGEADFTSSVVPLQPRIPILFRLLGM
jgi:hypothetical protein